MSNETRSTPRIDRIIIECVGRNGRASGIDAKGEMPDSNQDVNCLPILPSTNKLLECGE